MAASRGILAFLQRAGSAGEGGLGPCKHSICPESMRVSHSSGQHERFDPSEATQSRLPSAALLLALDGGGATSSGYDSREPSFLSNSPEFLNHRLTQPSLFHQRYQASPSRQQVQHRAYSSEKFDEENLAKEGEQPPKKGGTGSAGDETGLPLIQRCKNVLVSNWRGQLSSIYPGAAEGQKNAVRTSLVRYAILDGRPLIWLPRHDEHETNLIADKRASLMAGHTDPPALVQAVQKGCKRLPPLSVILGEVLQVDPSEAHYWSKRIRKISDRALTAIERAGPKAKALLETVGPTVDARRKALQEMAKASELRAYRLEPKEWTYMDVAGERKSGTAEEFEASLTDPLGAVSIPLIDALNRDQNTRKRLVLFSAAYMQVEARDAYVLSIDRWGFTCLVQRSLSIDPAEIGTPVTLKPGSKMGRSEGEWGEFRFAFSHEVRDAEGFCATLEAMEEDVVRHYKEESEKASDSASS